jgi:LPS-assembly protein
MVRKALGGPVGFGMVIRRNLYGLVTFLGVAGSILAAMPAHAQTMSDLIAKKMQGKQEGGKKQPLLVEARELVYNSEEETVSAVGDVQLYYEGRVLEADTVTYNRRTRQVIARGNAKLTDSSGQVAYGDQFELTDDFRDGFIDSLRVETTDKTRFSSPRAERIEGETTVFDKGTYTACAPCKDNPEKPPLWQVRAKRIIHKDSEHMVYYENATLEFFGVPIAYIPYFSAPDATVKRKSGFLAPTYKGSTALGYGASIPYFFNLAPNYDLTITPTILSRQGLLGQIDWRHRLMDGSYSIRAAGIFQRDPSAFLAPPYGAGNKDFRGSIETRGRFLINDKWQWGWDISLLSDKWFLQNYSVPSDALNAISLNFFKEAVSSVYLTGQGERSWFDARGYYFSALSAYDWQKQQPVVLPVVDYDRRFLGPSFVQGEVDLNMNLTSLSRQQAAYRSLYRSSDPLEPGRYLWPLADGARLYDTCLPGPANNPGKYYMPAYCYVNGISGNYTRVSSELAWRRTFLDPVGQSWTPFVSVRGDIGYTSLDTSGSFNQFMPNFIDTSGEVIGRFMPAAGVTYRYPFIAANDFGTHVIEPIAQVIVRPNETQIGALPNEDAQSLIYDDTSLFEMNKFTGYDRIEGGTRANLGAQYSLTTAGGAYLNALVGQSYQIAGRNSFATPDIARTGLDSGLDTTASDYVSRLQITPVSNFSFTARARWGEQDFDMKSLELQGTARFQALSASLIYGRYAPQPALGFYTKSEGLIAMTRVNLDKNWYVSAGTLVDLDGTSPEAEALYGISNVNSGPNFGYVSLGAGYQDECTTFGLVYTNSAQGETGVKERVQTVMLRLELRTLGSANVSQNLGAAANSQSSGLLP